MTTNLEAKTYIDENGARVFVSSGISRGEDWMTVRRKKTTAGTHRVKSPALQIRDTRDEAQHDLDAYAAKRGWEEA